MYRHYFDASAKTIVLPGAIIDKTLRQYDYSNKALQKGVNPKTVFLENMVTGLLAWG
jgi:hypothetical protein